MRLGHGGENLPCRIKSVQVRHSDIQQKNVRFQLAGEFNSFAPVFSLGANLPTGMVLQQGANAFSSYLVVVRDKDSKHAYLPEGHRRSPMRFSPEATPCLRIGALTPRTGCKKNYKVMRLGRVKCADRKTVT